MTKASKSDGVATERLARDLSAAKEWLGSTKSVGRELSSAAPAARWEQLTFEQRLALADAIRLRRRAANK